MNASQGPGDYDAEEYESFALNDSDERDERVEDADDLDDFDDDYDDDDDDYDDEDDDDLDDAEDEDIDLVVAAYTEEGQRTAIGLTPPVANDLDELVRQLRRLPGDAGAVGFVSLAGDMFVIARVRGPRVQVLLSDGSMAGEWPLARDVADHLDLDELPGEDDFDPIGDLAILEDSGVSEIAMAQYCDDDDSSTDETVLQIAEQLGLADNFETIIAEQNRH
ncbi:MAG TPA: tRNA adenosine deaminase-associated protein [Candidatus Avipropionibacterium avicola]|uniref:tRNA adenosine deaminase-associated protein n=1 Tax=Candidatus Avipropionibacterium avicola TaxID=2840701 RepID=A0A9D1KPF9_9ACTN|nr:tRNA adenosine deaminase-associated protein [Candidatus Avipropionibacterium avicola]